MRRGLVLVLAVIVVSLVGFLNHEIPAASAMSVVATIPVGTNPVGVAVNQHTNTVYVSNNNAGTVSVINASTNIVTATIPAGTFPEGIDVNPANNKIYVENGGSFILMVIN